MLHENPFKITTPEDLTAEEAVKLFVDVFTDFYQIKETYNTPGTSGDQNWSLRLPNNYAKLETINLNKILKAAIIARGTEFASKNASLIEKLS